VPKDLLIILIGYVRCNHDIQFLAGNIDNSLALMFYVTNYIKINGLTTFNATIFANAVFEKLNQFDLNPNDSTIKAKKLLSNCYNAPANNIEYSGAYVANMLLNNGKDGTYCTSDDHKCLNIFTLLQYLKNNNIFNEKMIPMYHRIIIPLNINAISN